MDWVRGKPVPKDKWAILHSSAVDAAFAEISRFLGFSSADAVPDDLHLRSRIENMAYATSASSSERCGKYMEQK